MSGAGQLYPGVGALEKASARLILQRLHLARERGLGLVQPGGGAAEAAFLNNHKERAQLGQHNVRGMRFPHGRNRLCALPGLVGDR